MCVIISLKFVVQPKLKAMYDILFKHLEEKVTLSQEDREIIKSYFVPKQLKKKETAVTRRKRL